MTVRTSLRRWIADLDARSVARSFPGSRISRHLNIGPDRLDDYYLSLVAELFDLMRTPEQSEHGDWALLGNALADLAADRDACDAAGLSVSDVLIFGSSAFYFGGYPASAYVVAQHLAEVARDTVVERDCIELLVRPPMMASALAARVTSAIAAGDLEAISRIRAEALRDADNALQVGPVEWISATLTARLMDRLAERNIRAILPDGSSRKWDPLAASLLSRRMWEFFPSQIQAIQSGLLSSDASFTLQMPTGAGKTALTETLLFDQAVSVPGSISVLIVPYRSLASELRSSMVRRLVGMGISARTAYGGTVPTGDEVRGLDDLAVLVATPETLSGLLGAESSFYRRVSLVICDEGHLLDGGNRGVALELLIARLKAREAGAPRFVFLSAIVPNVEEINSWLGGRGDTVVVSEYRPALAEFAVLHRQARNRASVDLVVHPEEDPPTKFSLHDFLVSGDFAWTNADTGRLNTRAWSSIKTMAIAAGRKAMVFGPVAVFAATKTGNQGAVGLAEELVEQVRLGLPLPSPNAFADGGAVAPVLQFLGLEFGATWIGATTLAAGAVLHHGDIPQESREVLERLVRATSVRLVICTTTLAEGVNLPIRTLVLYSVRRRTPEGRPQDLLTRDIRNLVGRAGRPGASTRGLVICANERDWELVRNVADQRPSEPVQGALHQLLADLQRALARQGLEVNNDLLETTDRLLPLTDGIDATLIDLISEELGEDEFFRLATHVASHTFAFEQAGPEASRLLEAVFELRAQRVLDARGMGRLAWLRASGGRLRYVDSVVSDLLPSRQDWDAITDPLDESLVRDMIGWAWRQEDLQVALRDGYRLERRANTDHLRESFEAHVNSWLQGNRFITIAEHSGRLIDDVLRIHAQTVSFALQTLIEQGVTLLRLALDATGSQLSAAVPLLAEHLRYGVPTPAGRALAAEVIRHRSAAVELGNRLGRQFRIEDMLHVISEAAGILEANSAEIEDRLGSLVVQNTREDLDAALRRLTA